MGLIEMKKRGLLIKVRVFSLFKQVTQTIKTSEEISKIGCDVLR